MRKFTPDADRIAALEARCATLEERLARTDRTLTESMETVEILAKGCMRMHRELGEMEGRVDVLSALVEIDFGRAPT